MGGEPDPVGATGARSTGSRFGTTALRTARRWFWGLTLLAIILLGLLTRLFTLDPGPAVGIAVAGTGTILLLAVAQAARLMQAIGQASPDGRK